MTRKTRNLYIIVSFVVLLAAAAYFLNNRKDVAEPGAVPSSSGGSPEITDLSTNSPEALRKLTVANGSGEINLISMDGESWLIDGVSKNFVPKEILLRSLVGNLSVIQGVLVETSPADYGVYGLNEPGAVVDSVAFNGESETVEFGNQAPSGNGRYARIPGKTPVYLVDSVQSNKAFWTLNDLRETRLPEVNIEALSSVNIRLNGQTVFRTEPHNDGLGPFLPLRASMDIVSPWSTRELIDDEKFIQFIQKNPPPSKISGFPEGPVSDRETGFGTGSDAIYLESGDGNSLNLEIGNSDGKGHRFARAAAVPESVFLIDEAELGLLNIKPYEVTSPFVFLAGIDRVREIRISGGKAPIILSIEKLGDPEDDADDVFTINGLKVSEKVFKKAYQGVIGLLREGAARRNVGVQSPIYTMEFFHVDPSVTPVTIEYSKYDDIFLTAGIRGRTPEFVIGRYQLTLLIESLEALIKTL